MAKNKTQCPYGHFYNADRYPGCPTCNPSLSSVAKNSPADDGLAAAPPQKVTTASRTSFSPLPQSGAAVAPTESVFGDNAARGQNVSPLEKTASVFQPPLFVPVAPIPAVPVQEEEAPPSLQDAVAAAVSYQDMEDVKTVAMWNAPSGTEPVVGWLVCVSGAYFGQSFPLKAGNNAVGRAMNMDIPLAQEPSVSRNKHCVITFEPQSQTFYVQQGESSGLTYLNGSMVLTPAQMKANDRVRLGQAEFFLFPLCEGDFRWENFAQ